MKRLLVIAGAVSSTLALAAPSNATLSAFRSEAGVCGGGQQCVNGSCQ